MSRIVDSCGRVLPAPVGTASKLCMFNYLLNVEDSYQVVHAFLFPGVT